MTTKNNEYIYQQLNNKKRQYKEIIVNKSDKKQYIQLNTIEEELNKLLLDVKTQKKKIIKKNKYKMKNLIIN